MPAFSATFSDLKLVKTRQVAQLIFEVPIEQFDQAYEILGGVPVPGKERWFGIAAIKTPKQQEVAEEPSREKMNWRDMQPAAQCALRCSDATFRAFLMEEHSFRPRGGESHEEQATHFLRSFFGIQSRSELGTDHRKRVLWKQLDDQFQAWRVAEHA